MGKGHPTAARAFVENRERAEWHDTALWFVREKRDKQAASLPEWELLRETASSIKRHAQSQLADYLLQFEHAATANGAVVHWANTTSELNEIVTELLQSVDATDVVKSKSMLTEECHLNEHLAKQGIDVVDTDLGERIVQMRNERPSHIVLPAIHTKKEEVGELFHEQLGTEKGATDPQYLTEAARQHLREKFLNADAAITGVNFAIADTGGIVVCTNEGNADIGVSLPKMHIACMGLEKLIPKLSDLSVFTRLLARSATGQSITTYTSHFHKPRRGGELHIVILNNGRTELRSEPEIRDALHCIRCGACMNTCPVYRRSGGHSYNTTVPGPIGSVLNPSMDPKQHNSLPFACSLCGSCSDVCPVQIPLHHQLLTIRHSVKEAGGLARSKRLSMRLASMVFKRPWLYKLSAGLGKCAVRLTPRFIKYSRLNVWGKGRELPPTPRGSFRKWYDKNGGSRGK